MKKTEKDLNMSWNNATEKVNWFQQGIYSSSKFFGFKNEGARLGIAAH